MILTESLWLSIWLELAATQQRMNALLLLMAVWGESQKTDIEQKTPEVKTNTQKDSIYIKFKVSEMKQWC